VRIAENEMDDVKMAEVEALAESLGNVLEACRRLGVSRSLFYKWLRRKQGGQPPGGGTGEGGKRRRHPQATPEPLLKRVLELAAGNPEWGCDRISHYLSLHKARLSPTTVQKILTRNGLRTREERAGAPVSGKGASRR
jgi:transposase